MILQSSKNVLVIGTLPRSRAVEIRTTQNGRQFAKFSVRADSVRKEDGSYDDTWLECVAWGEAAHMCAVLKPGGTYLLAGEKRTRSWTGRDGEERTAQELNVTFVCEGIQPRTPEPTFIEYDEPAPKQTPKQEQMFIDDDDLSPLPF